MTNIEVQGIKALGCELILNVSIDSVRSWAGIAVAHTKVYHCFPGFSDFLAEL